MSNIVNIDEHDKSRQVEIENEAAAWIVQLYDAKPTAEDLKDFESWLQSSHTHRTVFERMARTWRGADCLSELAFPVRESEDCRSPGPAAPVFRFAHAFAGGIIICLIAIAAALFQWSDLSIPAEQHTLQAHYETAVGELKKVTLPDGTGMRLNTRSRTKVNYKKDARLVHLLEGEVHFEVRHDTSKPFVVYAGKIAVRAVGTAFSVYMKEDSVDVIVTEGEVRIVSLPRPPAAEEAGLDLLDEAETVATFVQGQRAVFRDKIELVQSMKSQEITRKLSWRDGMLIFDGDSLQDVVHEVSRYTSKEIIILDAETRDMKIGGYFRAGDINPMLETLSANFGLKVDEINDNLIYLSQQ